MLAGSIVFLVAGFAILLYSGDCLVRGALAAAFKANVSPLLVGILIVGFGTSLPELFIAISSAYSGETGLAHGNIVGSNIANIFLVLALPAVIFPITTGAPRMRATALVMVAATAAWIGVTYYVGLTPLVGWIFLGALAVYAIIAWSFARRDMTVDTAEDLKMMATPFWRMSMLILIGLVGLPLGSRLLVDGAISLAEHTALSEEAVGLTILAVGTSLPELGAGIAAAFRKQSDVAMGNILGANIFNILGSGGAIALIRTQQLSPEFHNYSHWAMALAALLVTGVLFLKKKIGWLTAVFFLALYVLYITGLVENWTFRDFLNPLEAAAPAPGN